MTVGDAIRSHRSTLAADAVHVWLTLPDRLHDPSLLAAYADLMSPAEREKQQRYHFEKGRHECLVTRALVRTVLSRYTEMSPDAWMFEANSYGRPELTPGQCALPLRFNLSHTDGLIACAVALDRDVGVDVESLNHRGETVTLADHYFSKQEVHDLHQLPEDRQRERFLAYWTLKESYIKARGMGLAISLGDFGFRLEDHGPIRISFQPRIHDDPSDWQFALYRPTPSHLLAVGVHKGRGDDLRISVRQTIPLME